MLKRAPQRVFPLHLAPIDEFFWQDDRPDYPMTFTSHLYFSGSIRREAFDAALAEALVRHPLLRALVKPVKANKPCWVSSNGLAPKLDWGPLGTPYELPSGEPIDLAREVGLRIWVRQGGANSEILLQFHHACCDGTGAYRFIGDLLAEYGLRTADGENRPVVESCDQQLLRTRRAKMISQAYVGNRFHLVRRGIGHGCRLYGKRIMPLSSSDSASVGETAESMFPGVETYTFDRDEHRQLRDAAGKAGVMLNDLLLNEMFRAMHEWNARQPGGRHRPWLRIMMPTDLREKEDILMPAANMTSYSFITRRGSDCEDRRELLRGIRDETALIKHEKRGKQFIDSVMMSKFVPGLLGFLLNRNRCLATLTLSNVGDPTRRFLSRFPREQGKVRCGNLRLEKISGVPPMRPHTRATVSIVTYARQLSINMRCDPHSMTADDTCDFLAVYARRLGSHLPQPVPRETVGVS